MMAERVTLPIITGVQPDLLCKGFVLSAGSDLLKSLGGNPSAASAETTPLGDPENWKSINYLAQVLMQRTDR